MILPDLPTDIETTYPDRSPGDSAHQQHHDAIHQAFKDLNAAGGAVAVDDVTTDSTVRKALDGRYARQADVSHIDAVAASYAPASLPPAILDLHYRDRMALYGVETFTRSTTDTYTDMTGASKTAAIDTPAFDRNTQGGWLLPAGMKIAGNALATLNPSLLLPAEYTVVLDCDRPTAFSNSGAILSLNSGSVANRVELGLSGSYTAYFTVQAGGTVVVNQALGATQTWYGGRRRLVIAVKGAAFNYSDTGMLSGSTTSGAAPSPSGLTRLDLGNSTFAGWVGRVRILPKALSLADVVNLAAGSAPVACWGDSLTAGTGASGPSGYWPEVLRATRVPMSGVFNGGVGGETSTQIKTRMLADTIRRDWTTVIWAGRNNTSALQTVLDDVAAMVGNLTHRRFLVLAVINRSDGTEGPGTAVYDQIIAINSALAAAYPDNYLDIRSLIVAASGGTGDAPASSWTADGLHLNNTGYAYVASQVGAFLRGKLWA